MAINLEGIVTWLKGWFYDKTEITGFLNNKANQSDLQTLQGTVTSLGETVNGKIDTAGTGLSKSGTTLNHSNSVTELTFTALKKISYDEQGHITGTANVTDSDLPLHNHSISNVTHLQQELDGIDTRLDNLESIKAIEVVSDKGTASADKLGKLFIVNENSKVNVYYVKQTGTGSSATYSWEKMDTDILDEYVVNWLDVQGRPTKTSDFTNDGADGTNVFVANNDSRLTNARTPTSHASSVPTYGVGTTSNYGHNKIRDNLTASTLTDGESLSAHQGYVLNQAKQDKITSIALVSKNTDENGKIIFYTGDEPT